MELTFDQRAAGCADGTFMAAGGSGDACLLYWADENGALPDWACFAAFPLDSNGMGIYHMEGGRGIPPKATHVLARMKDADHEEKVGALVPIPLRAEPAAAGDFMRFLVMTDLHVSRKPWTVRQALEMGNGYDGILISGDIVNDGQPEQLELFWRCVLDKGANIPVFAVAGNHDYPPNPLPLIAGGVYSYPILQKHLLERGRELGYDYEQDSSGAYCVSAGMAEVIGLNAATHFRKFKFSDGAQLDWLKKHLEASTALRHIILCHAPPFAHRAYKGPKDQPYLNRDKELQRILDTHTGIVFVSGHTHLSMNGRESCVERDVRGNIYLNAGSICPTTMKEKEAFLSEEWKRGNVVELLVGARQTVVTAVSVGKKCFFPRGYYRF